MTPAREVSAVGHRFGLELRRAMIARNVSTRSLAAAARLSARHVTWCREGRSLPQITTDARMAEALDWPKLMEIVRQARSYRCVVCGRGGIDSATSTPRKYCSDSCWRLGRKSGRRGGPLPVADRRIALYHEAVGAFCLSCNPTGLCHDGECALRPISPLPLLPGKLEVPRAPDGRRTRWDRPNERDRYSRRMAAVHAERPEWRKRVAEANRQRWAAMSPEERAAIGARIAAGVRAARAREAA